jgi:3-phosphoshikimate 1-carboxyvinyltransferase
LEGGDARIDAGESSQYLSALLMAALCARKATTLTIESLRSQPYVDLTLDAIEQFGGKVEGSTSGTFRVIPQDLHGGRFTVEGDWSAAAYPAAAATLVGGLFELEGLELNSRQGDRRFLDVLARMGAVVQVENGRVVVEGTRQLFGLEVDMSDIPDQVPTLAALAPFAKGITRISNVPHLRLKESDRLQAMTAELRRAGATVEELADGLVIPGRWADAEPPSNPVKVESHQDHRIAMSMAITGLRRSGLAMLDANVVSKSYPDFWKDLGTLVRA